MATLGRTASWGPEVHLVPQVWKDRMVIRGSEVQTVRMVTLGRTASWGPEVHLVPQVGKDRMVIRGSEESLVRKVITDLRDLEER